VRRLNPKDIAGMKKPGVAFVPAPVMMEVGAAMEEGARKYGPYNWREIPIQASVYYNAALRHLMAWWEREDIDPDSGISHVTKAISGLMVLRDAMRVESWRDDRPGASDRADRASSRRGGSTARASRPTSAAGSARSRPRRSSRPSR
jgi:hypothetical protein